MYISLFKRSNLVGSTSYVDEGVAFLNLLTLKFPKIIMLIASYFIVTFSYSESTPLDLSHSSAFEGFLFSVVDFFSFFLTKRSLNFSLMFFMNFLTPPFVLRGLITALLIFSMTTSAVSFTDFQAFEATILTQLSRSFIDCTVVKESPLLLILFTSFYVSSLL